MQSEGASSRNKFPKCINEINQLNSDSTSQTSNHLERSISREINLSNTSFFPSSHNINGDWTRVPSSNLSKGRIQKVISAVNLHFAVNQNIQSGSTTVEENLEFSKLSVVVLGGFGCYVSCPNAVSSRVIHLVFHRLQHNCFSSLDSINMVYQHP
jgi:hypothetical protein